MTVSFQLKPSDHWALTRYVMTHDARMMGSMAFAALIIPMVLVQSMLRQHKSWQEAVGSAAFILVFAAVFGYPMFRYLSWKRFRAMPAHVREMELSLDDAGVHVSTSRGKQALRWSAVLKVRRDRTAVYLFLSRRAALIVPIRAFASRADLESFLDFAVRHAQT